LALGTIIVAISFPCAGVYRQGEEAAITREAAVIVYEPDSQTQTFIRSATFDGKGGDFGFIVPTPSEPDLSEIDGKVFTEANKIFQRRYPPKPYSGLPNRGGGGGAGAGWGSSDGVAVLKVQSLAGMRATVLKASDSNALRIWLEQNKYPVSPEIMVWASEYVRQNYFLTAFKMERKLESDQTHSATVKMVFQTKIPFYLYREPAYRRPKGKDRHLTVFFFAPYLARARYMNSRVVWEAESKPVDDLDQGEAARVKEAAKLEAAIFPVPTQMTYFLDKSQVRKDRDVLFVPADLP